ncbi:MAG: ATP-binding cassette domain-containing protein [Bacilli bacterium]|nr:ATP-binding cassette domain-containing protein [Bacilli bacterium]
MKNEKVKVIELQNITKTFGSIVANKNVNLDLYKGEILSILGENGSGKTTAMNIISGLYAPEEGSIYINGEKVSIKSPEDSLRLGIGMVHQHFKLVDVFTAAENILLGLNKKDYKESSKNVYTRVKEMCDMYGFELDPYKKVYNMTVSEKQTLEIVKALFRNVDILILDEPTAVLTPQEIRHLFEVVKNMRKNGKSIVIITHKLNEVMEISDRVAIFRKGEHIATVETKKTSIKELTDMMVGAKVDLEINRTEPVDVADRLFVNNISVRNNDGQIAVKNVSFVARSGEILGIAGISGSGQKELLEAIQGLRPMETGEVIFHNPKKDKPATFFHKTLSKIKHLAAEGKFHDPEGNKINFHGMSNKQIRKMVNDGKVLFYEDEIVNLKGKNPLQIRELGIRLSFVPEDRLGMGLVSNMNLVDNTMLRSYRHGHWIFLDRSRPKKLVEKIIKDLNVSTPGTSVRVSKLSGGNVQKVLVGREIALIPKVFMAAYPVRGLDINSSYLIYNLLDQQKRNGIAVIYVGEDLDVLLALCDRILVICDGRITGLVDARKTTKEEVGMLMTKHEEVQ